MWTKCDNCRISHDAIVLLLPVPWGSYHHLPVLCVSSCHVFLPSPPWSVNFTSYIQRPINTPIKTTMPQLVVITIDYTTTYHIRKPLNKWTPPTYPIQNPTNESDPFSRIHLPYQKCSGNNNHPCPIKTVHTYTHAIDDIFIYPMHLYYPKRSAQCGQTLDGGCYLPLNLTSLLTLL